MIVGFSALLTIVLIVLKLTGIIAWSWWLVTAPVWVGPVAFAYVLTSACVLAWIMALLCDRKARRGRKARDKHWNALPR